MAVWDKEFQKIFGEPCWSVKSARFNVLEEPDHTPMLGTFVKIVAFLRLNRVPIQHETFVWQDYVAFALRWFHSQGIVPVPPQIMQPTLLRKFAMRQVTHQAQEKELDYRKRLHPRFRSPDYLRLLGLA